MAKLGEIASLLKQLKQARKSLGDIQHDLAWCDAGAPAEEHLKAREKVALFEVKALENMEI